MLERAYDYLIGTLRVCFFVFSSTTIWQFKIWMYIVFVAGEDIETQRNGMIMICWPGALNPKLPNARFRRYIVEALQCIPMRFACFHLCLPPTPFFQILRAFIVLFLKAGNAATRVKVHSGTFSLASQNHHRNSTMCLLLIILFFL